MNLIPKAAIVGMMQGQMLSTGPVNTFIQTPSSQPITSDTINRIWSQVIKEYPYQSLQLEPSGRGGVFIGGPDELVIIQPPLLQMRCRLDSDPTGIRGVADKVHFVFGQIMHQLPSPPPLNLGVKLIYNTPAPGGDAVAFARTELVKGEDDLRTLAGGTSFVACIKVAMMNPDVNRTLLVEPLIADPTQLFLDLDSQFPGVVNPAQIREHITGAGDFMTHQVDSFLDARSAEWGA